MEKPSVETGARTKEGQGLDYWAASLLKQGIINQREYDTFIKKNNSKEKLLAERGLPQLQHYGQFVSTEEMREKIRPREGERFIIRCKSKETGEIRRLIDASFEEICDFAEHLPGEFAAWNVEIKEFAESIAAGTIVVAPNGHTTLEAWHGAHYLNTTNVPKYHAEFDPEQFHQHYHWRAPEGATDLPEMQQYAIQALRHHFPYLRPEEGKPIYIEYGVKKNGQVYFIEANDDALLTGK